jgi:hypothetical protein
MHYLQEMPTNIGALQTEGLLNSHASRFTTTNVGQLHGGRSSVITLGELSLMDKLHLRKGIHFTKEQAAAIEAKADAAEQAAIEKVKASSLTDAQKVKAIAALKLEDAEVHKFVDAHTDQELQALYCTLTHLGDCF